MSDTPPIQWLTPRFGNDSLDDDGAAIPTGDVIQPSSDFAYVAGRLMAAAIEDRKVSGLSFLLNTSVLLKRPPPPPLPWWRMALSGVARRFRRIRYLTARSIVGYEFHGDDECDCYDH